MISAVFDETINLRLNIVPKPLQFQSIIAPMSLFPLTYDLVQETQLLQFTDV